MAVQEYISQNLHQLIKKCDFTEICRICLNKKEIENLFFAEFERINVLKMLEFLDIEISENDDGPQNICKTCIEHIYHSYIFFNYWKQSCKIINTILLETEPDRIVKAEAIEPELILNECDSKNELENISKQENASLNCILCDFEARTEEALQKHYSNVHSIKFDKANNEFKCRICKINMESVESLENHCNSEEHLNSIKSTIKKNKSIKKVVKKKKILKRKRKIAKEKKLSCTICNEDFDSFQDIFNHFENEHIDSQICIICNKLIKSHLKLHMQSHELKGRKFFCRTCMIFFENQAKLDEHNLSKDHIKKSQRICSYCDKQFRNARCLNNHVQLHKLSEAGSISICEICGQSFGRKTSMLRHVEVVHEGKRFYCSQCPKTFTANAKLKMHIAKQHSTEPLPDKVKKYLCNQCPKTFSCKRRFDKHLTNHTSDHIPCQVTSCTEKFLNKEALYQHLKSNHETLNCLKCNKQYYNSDKFQSHLAFHEWEAVPDPLSVEGEGKPCKACGEHFENEDSLLQHVRNVHKVYLCHCKKAFTSYYNLSSHVSKIHRSRKEIKCEVCGKILCSNTTFKEHMDKHENIQRHTCHICNKSFTYKNYYQIHMRSHSEEEPQKVY